MASESDLQAANRLTTGFLAAGVVVFATAVALVALAALTPVDTAGDLGNLESRGLDLAAWSESRAEVDPLLRRMAGRRLIRPPEVQAAVKDTGLAGRLIKRLTLEGVVQIGQDFAAYIRVDKKSLETVRQGQNVLDFVVERIEPGKVTLSLQGVEVVLAH